MEEIKNWVIAYFESDSHAEIAGIFPSEESYLSCVPTLEKIAEKSNMKLTETTELTWEEVCQAKQFTNETRIYVLNTQDISIDKGFEELTEEEWIAECEKQGRIYSLQGFERAFNKEEISTFTDVIKIIKLSNYKQ